MYSRHAIDSVNCENSSVSFVMKYCPTSTVFRTYKSLSVDLVVEAFPLVLCASAIDFLVRESQSKVLGVIINKFAGANNGSYCPANTDLSVLV